MLYYDQGMFEEVNYQTSAIPAEVATGGIYMNMVTKNAGNLWRGDVRLLRQRGSAERQQRTRELERFNLPGGNPIQRAYDFNAAGGGAAGGDKLWVNGAYRKWRVDKLKLIARNPDGTPRARRQRSEERTRRRRTGSRPPRSGRAVVTTTTTRIRGTIAATRRRTSSRIRRRWCRPTPRRPCR